MRKFRKIRNAKLWEMAKAHTIRKYEEKYFGAYPQFISETINTPYEVAAAFVYGRHEKKANKLLFTTLGMAQEELDSLASLPFEDYDKMEAPLGVLSQHDLFFHLYYLSIREEDATEVEQRFISHPEWPDLKANFERVMKRAIRDGSAKFRLGKRFKWVLQLQRELKR